MKKRYPDKSTASTLFNSIYTSLYGFFQLKGISYSRGLKASDEEAYEIIDELLESIGKAANKNSITRYMNKLNELVEEIITYAKKNRLTSYITIKQNYQVKDIDDLTLLCRQCLTSAYEISIELWHQRKENNYTKPTAMVKRVAAEKAENLATDKCLFNFSNKNYVIKPVNEEFIEPFDIFTFNDYCYNRSITYLAVYHSDKTFDIDKEFKTLYDKISYILFYICVNSDEEKIKTYLNFIPEEILPNKNRLLDYIKTIHSYSFSVAEKIKFLYNACIDMPLLNKYTKLKRDLMEQVILPNCTYNEALERLSDLFVSSRMFGNLEGLIIYNRSAIELDLMGEEEYNLRKKYGIYPSVISQQENSSTETEDLIRLISITADTRTTAIDSAMLFIKSFKTSNFEKGIEIAESAVLQLLQFTDEEYQELINVDTELERIREFERQCMEIIEQIVSEDINYTRADAIKIAQKRLDHANSDRLNEGITIYERVVKEFKIATDDEFTLLQKQIFS